MRFGDKELPEEKDTLRTSVGSGAIWCEVKLISTEKREQYAISPNVPLESRPRDERS